MSYTFFMYLFFIQPNIKLFHLHLQYLFLLLYLFYQTIIYIYITSKHILIYELLLISLQQIFKFLLYNFQSIENMN